MRELPDPRQERQALNWGLAGAFVLRVAMLVSASWTVKFWQVEVLGAIYKHFGQKFRNIETEDQNFAPNLGIESLGSVIVLIAFTDLAFSLDSMTTAIALADRFWILLTGGILGMLALRFLTGLFVRWLAEFVYLQDAAYLTVLAVGGRLLLKPCQPSNSHFKKVYLYFIKNFHNFFLNIKNNKKYGRQSIQVRNENRQGGKK